MDGCMYMALTLAFTITIVLRKHRTGLHVNLGCNGNNSQHHLRTPSLVTCHAKLSTVAPASA